jgi:aminoglycoside phosphotransferase
MLERIFPWSHEKKFWKWFVEHSDELFNFEADQQRIFDELAAQLKKVHESLTFEFGPIEDNKRDSL